MPGDIFSDDFDAGQTIQIPRFGTGQKIFRRYTLQKILGRGGMGVVWLARDEQLESLVALKVLPETICYDDASLDALKRETKMGRNLAHPNIVRIYDFQQDEHGAAISMEYVDGPTLSDLRITKSNQVFSTAELLDYVEALCDALNYAHTRERIVHRDLKPRNLMLNSRGEVKVADFGISRSISESMTMLTGKLGSSGSPPYISPQQWDGERPTPLDDIYSVGATLYELLSGKPPLMGVVDWQQVHNKIPPPMWQRRVAFDIKNAEPISAQWEETIAACLAKDPKDRPQTIRQLQARLTADRPATGTLPDLSAALPPRTDAPVAEADLPFSADTSGEQTWEDFAGDTIVSRTGFPGPEIAVPPAPAAPVVPPPLPIEPTTTGSVASGPPWAEVKSVEATGGDVAEIEADAAARAKADADKINAERLAAERAQEQKVAEEAKRAAQQKAAEEEAKRVAQQKAAEEEAKRVAQAKAAEQEAKRVAQAKAAEEEAKRVAQAKAVEEEAKRVAQAKAAEEAKRVAQQKAAEEEAKRVAQAKAVEEEAKRVAQAKAAEEAKRVAQQKAAEEEAKRVAQAKAVEEEAKRVAQAKAAEEAKRVAQQKAAEEEAKRVAQAKAAEEAKRVAQQKAAEEEAKRVAQAKAAEGAKRVAQEKAAEEEARRVAQKTADDASSKELPASKLPVEGETKDESQPLTAKAGAAEIEAKAKKARPEPELKAVASPALPPTTTQPPVPVVAKPGRNLRPIGIGIAALLAVSLTYVVIQKLRSPNLTKETTPTSSAAPQREEPVVEPAKDIVPAAAAPPAETDRINAERLVKEKADREQKAAEEAKLAAQKAADDERIAQEKKAADNKAKLAAQKAADDERIAQEKKAADNKAKLAAQKAADDAKPLPEPPKVDRPDQSKLVPGPVAAANAKPPEPPKTHATKKAAQKDSHSSHDSGGNRTSQSANRPAPVAPITRTPPPPRPADNRQRSQSEFGASAPGG